MTSDSLWSFREADRQQAPHLNRPSAIVANPTQATDIHRSLSTFGGESVPPGGRNPHLRDFDHLAASPRVSR